MSVRRALFFFCAFLAVLGSVGAVRSQVGEAPGCNAAVTPSPRLREVPEQPPQGLSPSAWSRITHQVRASRYDLSRRAGTDDRVVEADGVLDTADAGYAVWVATHPNLNLTYEFGVHGMRVQPRGAEQDAWNWGLELVGLGGEYGLQAVGPVSPHIEGNRVEYRRPGLLEWYTHDRRGVEQGFTIESVPTGATDRMRVEFTVSGTLAAALTSSGGGVLLRDAEGETALRYDQLYAFDAAGRDLPVWMELREENEAPQRAGSPHLALWVDIREADFPVTIDPLISTQVAKMTASDAAAGDEFGASVSISGDTVVVGARRNEDAGSGSGSAYVFERNTGGADNWGQVAKLTASDAAAFNQFGSSVSIAVDRIVVGAPGDNSVVFQPGSAYVFERNTGGADNWGQVAKLVASDPAVQDQFGSTVSISGETVVVGAPLNDDVPTDSGSAYVYDRNEGGADNWGEVVKLTASDAMGRDQFGLSVSISGDTLVVGAPLDDDPALAGINSGSVYVFERNAGGVGSWGEVEKIAATDAAPDAQFGHALSISGDMLAVGAVQDQQAGIDSGSAYVYERNTGGAGSWSELAKLVAADAVAGDRFGMSVSISADTAVVGAKREDGVGADSGSAYAFGRHGGGADNWGQVAKLTASDAASGDEFGVSVSISGGIIVAGAGLNDAAGLDSGSAYTFTFSGCSWQEFAKPVALDAASGDEFGNAIGISGDTVVVGAPLDVNRYVKGGAAYVYGRNAGGAEEWGQVAKLTAPDPGDGSGFGGSVSISGDTVVVGDPGSDAAGFGFGTGSAHVFQRNAGGMDNWGQVAMLIATDAASLDVFGESVSISGDTVVAGARGDDDAGDSSGSLYVFERNAGGIDNWGEVAKLTASDAAPGDRFGVAVSINEDTVVVGANASDGSGANSGAAYVLERNAGGADNWGEVARLSASDAMAFDLFGSSIAVSADTVVVGAPDHIDEGSRPGSAYVYGRNVGGAGNWGEVAKLNVPGVGGGDIGRSVSISGDTAVSGAQFDDSGGTASGVVYVFERNVGGEDFWGVAAKLTASDAAAFDQFGSSVAISGDSVVVGAFHSDYAGNASGAAYAFEFSCVACGDALGEPPEECDDGAANSDVVPDACRTDCRLPWCGDLVLDTGEECEDGNLVDNDGCDSNCMFTACGNGVVTAPEECDDGNAVSGDGCDVSCLLECFDVDGDGFGAPGTQCTGGAGPDCDDGDSQIWGTPGEVNLLFASETVISWGLPPGGTVAVYDVLRSSVVRDFRITIAICVESNDGLDTMATDATIPDPGSVLYYLIRAENACPDIGQGTVGSDSYGNLRLGRSCP